MANPAYEKTVDERQSELKVKLIATLKELPIIQAACTRAGISRDTYYRWRQEDKIFKRESQDALSHGIEFVCDMSESQLISLIKEKKMPAIAMWLKHNSPRYGSKTKSHTPVNMTEELTPEEEKLMIDALKMVSGNTDIDKTHG